MPALYGDGRTVTPCALHRKGLAESRIKALRTLTLTLTLTSIQLARRCAFSPRLWCSLLLLWLSLDDADVRGVLNNRWKRPSLPSISSAQQHAMACEVSLGKAEAGLTRRG